MRTETSFASTLAGMEYHIQGLMDAQKKDVSWHFAPNYDAVVGFAYGTAYESGEPRALKASQWIVRDATSFELGALYGISDVQSRHRLLWWEGAQTIGEVTFAEPYGSKCLDPDMGVVTRLSGLIAHAVPNDDPYLEYERAQRSEAYADRLMAAQLWVGESYN